MARRVFSSFHYRPDNWRAAQVRNIGAIEGNQLATDNDWESVTSAGDGAIERWIQRQMHGRSCVIVLAGSQTAKRKWIDYEIKYGWQQGKGVFAIHIHRLKNRLGLQSPKGLNPFSHLNLGGVSFETIAPCYSPPFVDSRLVYQYIATNIERWIENAIAIRGRF